MTVVKHPSDWMTGADAGAAGVVHDPGVDGAVQHEAEVEVHDDGWFDAAGNATTGADAPAAYGEITWNPATGAAIGEPRAVERALGLPRGSLQSMPMRRICGCGATIPATYARCAACVRRDNARRHAKQRAQGKDTRAWDRLRRARLALDGYRCQDCGKRTDLTVHLEPMIHLDFDLQLRHDLATIDDVVTLCRRCHGHRDAPRAKGGSARGGVPAGRPVLASRRKRPHAGVPHGVPEGLH